MDLNKEIEFKDGVLKQTITILTSAPGLMFTGIIFFLRQYQENLVQIFL